MKPAHQVQVAMSEPSAAQLGAASLSLNAARKGVTTAKQPKGQTCLTTLGRSYLFLSIQPRL